jgi:hypothetical protein
MLSRGTSDGEGGVGGSRVSYNRVSSRYVVRGPKGRQRQTEGCKLRERRGGVSEELQDVKNLQHWRCCTHSTYIQKQQGGGGFTLEDAARKDEAEGGVACWVESVTAEHSEATLLTTTYALYVPSGTKRNNREADGSSLLPNTWPTVIMGAAALVSQQRTLALPG